MNKKYSLLLAIVSTLFVASIIGTLSYFYLGKQGPIYDFDDSRDTQDILKVFDRDRYWLLSSEDYSPEFMLKHRAPNQELQYMGRLKIKVYRENDTFIGFTAYYLKNPETGCILFFAINPEFRGKEKGYAEKLMKYALGQIKKLGAQQVQLYVRSDNKRAQGFYKRIGFYETSITSGPGFYLQYDL
jgi:ribosomal protein S18 acetylase RimI-like enzyme